MMTIQEARDGEYNIKAMLIRAIHAFRIPHYSTASGSQTHSLNLLASHEHLKYRGQSFV